MTLIQSPIFVYLIAILVKRAVLDEIIIPAPGLIKPIVDEPTAEAHPTSISLIINNTFFFFKPLYFFLQYSLSILSGLNIFL